MCIRDRLNQCQLLSEDEHLQAVWLLLYELILRPTLEFYQSALLGLMMEFSDRFTLCMQRLETILENVRKNPKSLPLIERLTTTLHGKFQIGKVWTPICFWSIPSAAACFLPARSNSCGSG